MSNNIIDFPNKNITPDELLERAKGVYQNVVIIGYDKEGGLNVRSDSDTRYKDALFMVSSFQHKLLNGDYNE